MDNTHVAKLLLSFQRQTFDNICQSIEILQDYSETSVKTLVGQNQWIPEPGCHFFDQWATACRKGCQTVKETVDDGFDRWQEFIEGVDPKN